jgi:hypothetical protein
MKAKIIILTIFIMASFSEQLFACRCQGERSVQKEVEYDDAVLVGTIIAKELTTHTDSTIANAMKTENLLMPTLARYSFMVDNIYKGKITSDTISIFTGVNGAACGVRFEIGKEYIVYGKRETYFGELLSKFEYPKGENIFWTHTCMRTNLFRQEEINEIEKYAND